MTSTIRNVLEAVQMFSFAFVSLDTAARLAPVATYGNYLHLLLRVWQNYVHDLSLQIAIDVN